MTGPAEQQDRLRTLLREVGSAVVAFSGGVDSTYLALVATRELGDRVLVVTADSPSYPRRHREQAEHLARLLGFRHEIIETGELDDPAYRANPPDRCYYCKRELFRRLTALARERSLAVVLDGSNADDRDDYRPGRKAAREFGVRSPLDEVGLGKAAIRELARQAGLPTWDQPASACLSSRIPYFTPVTSETLKLVERAEDVLHNLRFRLCRVRHHGEIARIEVAREELARAAGPEVAAVLVRELKALGYRYVALDLEGYRTGSLNEGLSRRVV